MQPLGAKLSLRTLSPGHVPLPQLSFHVVLLISTPIHTYQKNVLEAEPQKNQIPSPVSASPGKSKGMSCVPHV